MPRAFARPLGELHDAALANLETMSKDLAVYAPRPEGATGGVAVIDTGDGYDAARILLPGLRGRLVAALGPTVMAGVPGRDLFVAWSAGLANRREFETKVRDMAGRMPHPVTDQIFVIDAGGIRLAMPSEL